MSKTIGIRREDKNDWERRVPLTPEDLVGLKTRLGLDFIVQPSPIRVYQDDEYRDAGITVSEDLSAASIIVAVKEVPRELLQSGKTYVYFAHVTKGQPYNMPMLRRLLDLGCSLLDYEKIADEKNRRLIFFGRHAGYAGMIETMWCLGRRLAVTGSQTPLARLGHAYQYSDLQAAKSHLAEIGEEISRTGLGDALEPLVFGFSGYGNVSQGAQEVFASLPHEEIAVGDLPAQASAARPGSTQILKVVFKEEDMVRPVGTGSRFDLQEYYEHPDRYRGCFEEHLPYLDVLVNAIYWEPRYPRLVTRQWAKGYLSDPRPRLKVIGDISCDVEGSIEPTLKVTQPDNPCFVYNPAEDAVHDGVEGNGPVIMAVDNLPCELPRESSQYFSKRLRDMIGDLANADWSVDFSRLALPPYLKKAVIVHRGEFAPTYRYLLQHIQAKS